MRYLRIKKVGYTFPSNQKAHTVVQTHWSFHQNNDELAIRKALKETEEVKANDELGVQHSYDNSLVPSELVFLKKLIWT